MTEYHIEPRPGNKKPTDRRQPIANAEIVIKHFTLFDFLSLRRVVSFFLLFVTFIYSFSNMIMFILPL